MFNKISNDKLNLNDYDYVIVGAGICGLTIARLKAEAGKKCLIIEKRDHIGGNAYSEIDSKTGIEVHKYGAHLFHTDDEKVWKFVNHFSRWTNYVHRVWTTHNNVVYPMPINLGTINQFFNAAYTPKEAEDLIKQQSVGANVLNGDEPKNLAEQGVKLIGKPLFDAFIKNYTAKQWQIDASQLPASIIKRLPVRYNYDNRYFNNKYEGLPENGYGEFFANIADHENIDILLNVKFADISKENSLQSTSNNYKLLYSGPIDEYYDYVFGELNWRSLRFEKEVKPVFDFQGCPVMNYADLEPKYTRIHEFKHFHPERQNSDNPKWQGYNFDQTVIVKEYPASWHKGDEPYYPVNTEQDAEKFAKYVELAKNDNIKFIGRLGNYAYYDMDKAFAHAFEIEQLV